MQSGQKRWAFRLTPSRHILTVSSMEQFHMAEQEWAWREWSCCFASWTTSARPPFSLATPSASHPDSLGADAASRNVNHQLTMLCAWQVPATRSLCYAMCYTLFEPSHIEQTIVVNIKLDPDGLAQCPLALWTCRDLQHAADLVCLCGSRVNINILLWHH